MPRAILLAAMVAALGALHCAQPKAGPARPRPDDMAKAVDLCNDGDAAACYRIGVKWAQAKKHAKSPFQSWKHFKMACEGGHAPGCVRLKALNEAACFAGNVKGCWNLGEMFRLGKRGIDVDLKRARRYFRVACRDGLARACYQLGVLWSQGGGGKLDLRRARKLYRKACAGGWEEACVNLPRR